MGWGCARVAGLAWLRGAGLGWCLSPRVRVSSGKMEEAAGGSVGNVASLMKGTQGWSCHPGWQYMAWYRVQKRFLQVAVASFGHLSGTGLGSDSWLCPGGALEKETVAKLWLSPVFFGS